MRNRKRRRLVRQAAVKAVEEAASAPVVEELTAPVEELATPVEEEPKKTRKRKSLFSKD